MTCFVFPGQGSQFLGMAKDFHDNFDLAKKIFEEIEDYSKIDLRKIIFENIENKLNITRFTQICIFACSYVIFKISLQESDISLNDLSGNLQYDLTINLVNSENIDGDTIDLTAYTRPNNFATSDISQNVSDTSSNSIVFSDKMINMMKKILNINTIKIH